MLAQFFSKLAKKKCHKKWGTQIGDVFLDLPFVGLRFEGFLSMPSSEPMERMCWRNMFLGTNFCNTWDVQVYPLSETNIFATENRPPQ